jgi:hypothetical protein
MYLDAVKGDCMDRIHEGVLWWKPYVTSALFGCTC